MTKMKDRIEVTHEGQRAYMSIYFEGSLQGYPLTIGLRSTYDRSASIGIAVGPSIFICSNQIIHGDDITLFRKHTTGAMRDLGDMYRKAFEAGTARYDDRVIWMEGAERDPSHHPTGSLPCRRDECERRCRPWHRPQGL